MPEVEDLHAKEARVQALATLFDEGTEDAQVNPNPPNLTLTGFFNPHLSRLIGFEVVTPSAKALAIFIRITLRNVRYLCKP